MLLVAWRPQWTHSLGADEASDISVAAVRGGGLDEVMEAAMEVAIEDEATVDAAATRCRHELHAVVVVQSERNELAVLHCVLRSTYTLQHAPKV